MAIYMKYDGISGNVTADGFADHIAVDDVNFGISRGITMEAGNMSNREATRPTLTEIHLTKYADTSVTSLFKEAVTGVAGKTVEIKFVRSGSDSVVEFMNYTLENCMISGYSITATAEGEPVENISLSFSKIMVSYNDHDALNTNSNPQRVGYDLATGKPL